MHEKKRGNEQKAKEKTRTVSLIAWFKSETQKANRHSAADDEELRISALIE